MRRWSTFHRPTVVLSPGLWLTAHHYRGLIDWFKTLGFAVDVPTEHVRGDLDAKALALTMRGRAYQHGGVILLAHSFGAVVAHRAFDLAPDQKELVRGFIAIAPVSPRGFEREVVYRVMTRYPRELWEELWSDSFRIPSSEIFQGLFGSEMRKDDWLATVGEDTAWLRFMFVRALLYRSELTDTRLRVPKLFLGGHDDQLVHAASLEEWRDYYHMCHPAVMDLPGSHCGILSREETFVHIGQWTERYFSKYI